MAMTVAMSLDPEAFTRGFRVQPLDLGPDAVGERAATAIVPTMTVFAPGVEIDPRMAPAHTLMAPQGVHHVSERVFMMSPVYTLPRGKGGRAAAALRTPGDYMSLRRGRRAGDSAWVAGDVARLLGHSATLTPTLSLKGEGGRGGSVWVRWVRGRP